MFYDERIHAESGKIYKRGIFLAVLAAIAYALIRMLSTGFAAKNYMAELFVAVCGICILLGGLVRFYGAADERTESEKHTYYFNAGKLMIIAAISGYALTLPFVRQGNDFPANHFIIILEMLGYMYFFYSFKSRDINFNYTFIAEDKRAYFGRVFENIGKLAAVLLLPFVISAFLDFSVNGSFLRFWSVLNGYLFSVLGLGLEYLLISWIEKLSYEDESENLLKKGTIIAAITWFILFIISEALEVWQYYVMEHSREFSDIIQSFGAYLSELSYRKMYLSYGMTAVSAVLLCHIMSAVPDVKAVRKGVWFYFVAKTVSLVWSLSGNIVFMYFDLMDVEKRNTLSAVNTFAHFVLLLICAGSLATGARALVKAKRMSSVLVFLPFLSMVGDILVRTFSEYQHEWLMPGIIIVSLFNIVGCVLAFCLFKKRDGACFNG